MDIAAVLLVGLLWGATNPAVEKGAKTVKARLESGPSASSLQSIWIHCTTPSFIIPHSLNTAGSILFVHLLSLSSVDLGFVVPAANATALAITGLISAPGPTQSNSRSAGLLTVGLVLVCTGILLCSWS
uniref:Transmembrane protein 234 n=1 Tax=Dunaliella tertiolecta TaxID=3047 RepID=A0A7S3VNB5_DUNTE